MMETCYFNKIDKCIGKDTDTLLNARETRIRTIIQCSKSYNDDLWIDLDNELQQDDSYSISVHKSCVSVYTNKNNVSRHLKRKGDPCSSSDTGVSPAKTRRSSGPEFKFKHHCLFCGKECDVKRDKKHPHRWRPAYPCRLRTKNSRIKY